MNSDLNQKMAKPDWSMLLVELLVMMLAKLDLADHVRFTAVCKHWRSVAVDNPDDKKPFILVRSNDPERLIHSLVVSFSNSWKEVYFIGSFEGWLALLFNFKSLVLVNPSSGEAPIPLPPLGVIYRDITPKVVISSTPTGEYLVVLQNRQLSFCRPGDTAWTPFYPLPGEYRWIRDIAFYKDQLYAVNWEGLIVFDSGLNSNPRLCFKANMCFLVNASDMLLWFKIKFRNKPSSFKLSQIDPRRDSSPLEVKSLGDNIVFPSIFGSVCLPAKNHPEFRPNHIYMQFNPRTLYSFSVVEKSVTRVTRTERRPIFFDLFTERGFNKLTDAEKRLYNFI